VAYRYIYSWLIVFKGVTALGGFHRNTHPEDQFRGVTENIVGQLKEIGFTVVYGGRQKRCHVLGGVEGAGKIVGTEVKTVINDNRELHPVVINSVAVKNTAEGYGRYMTHTFHCKQQKVIAYRHTYPFLLDFLILMSR
jgi:hypothetical protein